MPKRSNEFQRLVKLIHEAFSSTDGTIVTESALLLEPDGTPREVDILVERSVSDVAIRLAIECRDRSRKSDVEWIDGLIGKFKNLKIDKVIAVCRSGFSAAASSKAEANKFELRVLEECLENEWASEFMRLGIAMFNFTPRILSVEITIDPTAQTPISMETTVEFTPLGAATISVGQLVLACFQKNIAPRVKKYVEDEFLAKNPPLADLTKSWAITVPVDINDTWVKDPTGSRHRLVSMKYEVGAESFTEISSVRHFQYGTTAIASEGEIKVGQDIRKVRVVQVAGQNTLTVNFADSIKK